MRKQEDRMTAEQTKHLTRIAKRCGRPLPEVIEMFEERAAIREYEGGAKRTHAERDALADVADVVPAGRVHP